MSRALMLLLTVFGGCASFESGPPTGSTTVSAGSVDQVLEESADVLRGLGYATKGRKTDAMTFERPAGTMGEVLYGNWGVERRSVDRLVVEVTPLKNGSYRIALLRYAVRDPGLGMEDTQRWLGGYSSELKGALRLIKRRLASAPAAGNSPPPSWDGAPNLDRPASPWAPPVNTPSHHEPREEQLWNPLREPFRG